MSEAEFTTTAALIDEGVLEIGDGYRAKNAEFVGGGGLPFVRVADIRSRIKTAVTDELPLSERERYEPKVSRPGDCVITMKGTVGRVAFVSERGRTFVYSPQLSFWRVLDPTRLVPSYLRYWLQGPEFLEQASATKGSTDMADYINLRDQRRMRISLPPIGVQQRVASVLLAIDELIETTERRFEVLDDLVGSLYREWFVRFRFPEHEGVELVDSELGPIPLGWHVVDLGDAAGSLVDGDWIETKDQGGQDYRLLQVSNIGVGTFRETGNFRFITRATFERLRCTEIRLGDILISRMPDPIGRAWLVDELPMPAITAVDVAILRPVSSWSGIYLSLWLNSEPALAYAEAVATGTTRKRISRSVLSRAKVLLPPDDQLSRFGERVTPILQWRAALASQVVQLSATRDLLIPRLVSGRLDVSELDLGDLLPAGIA